MPHVGVILIALGFTFSGAEVDKFTKEDKNLKKLQSSTVTTVKSVHGETYDCVDIYKQPAFDHPALAAHKVQVRGSRLQPHFQLSHLQFDNYQVMPVADSQHVIWKVRPSKKFEDMLARLPQGIGDSRFNYEDIWMSKKACLPGTVPIRRMTKEQQEKAGNSSRKLHVRVDHSKAWNHGVEEYMQTQEENFMELVPTLAYGIPKLIDLMSSAQLQYQYSRDAVAI
ncbi:hypothetical protein RJ640_020079 [Escallonia rubra]|uniref:Neprosin activation peptide domain-containing protein n=1 Tax=Escallonia rubra TaxID=112253 RepID=A0AA88R208_9ASTE|nr:hypothetical protein RJ640_020079 [Escallonia rubra]